MHILKKYPAQRAKFFYTVMFVSFFLWIIAAGASWGNETRSVKETIQEMTIDQKVAQLIMVGFNGTTLSAPMQKLLKDIPVGGIILFRHNLYKGKKFIKELTEEIQVLLKKQPPCVPAFIAVDLEGGIIKRFTTDVIAFPSARNLGDRNDLALVESECIKAARILSALGINMNLAPVLEPCGPVMKTRVFGCDIQKVAEMGVHFTSGFQSQGVIATGKHFPGNGGVDQHQALGRIDLGISEFKINRLPAYDAAIKAGIGAIMTSHVYFSAIDDSAPVPLSKLVVTEFLKKQLKFGGVVISDDLLCASKKGVVLAQFGTVPENAVRAVQSGVDVIMLSDANYARTVYCQIKNALVSGIISKNRLDDSVMRILSLKRKFNIF